MNNQEVIQRFTDYIESERHYSDHTLTSYLTDVESLIHFLNKERFGDLIHVTTRIARFYVATLHEHYSPKSIARKISSVRTLYNFLAGDEIVDENPFQDIDLPKQEKKLPRFIYPQEIEHVLGTGSSQLPHSRVSVRNGGPRDGTVRH